MSEYLTLHEEPGELRRPIIIMAFSGWNDAGEAATGIADLAAAAMAAEGMKPEEARKRAEDEFEADLSAKPAALDDLL